EAGTAEHELAEFDNQAGMLRNRNETPWRYFALDGMNPARQRLDADQLLAAWIDDRLIDDVQLLISDRLTERAFQQFAVREIGVHRGIVDARPVAAFVLGAIERHIGVTQDVAGVLDAAIDHRDADRRDDIDAMSVEDERRANDAENAFCDRLQRIAVRSAGHNDGEFIAAEPSDQVVVIDDLAQSLGDIDNELIADMVAERVVDVLEMIKINVKHSGGRAAVAAGLQVKRTTELTSRSVRSTTPFWDAGAERSAIRRPSICK